ncbi:hypothetical protein [Nocardia stercoris]|uniref:Uncharacterized protein n=1 Tax=Nocardia stercoris TaxID=2483361 RepID=A0A3M2LBD4_9NOCA|nr:hypothetical protein [Nocardia stercoris]RMI34837.1 hypothetical protein EBN03_00145 [Nocardia stercoris]
MTFTAWVSARKWLLSGLAMAVVGYVVLRAVLTALSARAGFGSPDGPTLAFLAVAAMVSALRGLLLIVVPAVVAYRLASWAVGRFLSRPSKHDPKSPVVQQNQRS